MRGDPEAPWPQPVSPEWPVKVATVASGPQDRTHTAHSSSAQTYQGRQVTCVVLRVKSDKNLLEMALLVYCFQILKLHKNYDLSPMNTKLFLQGTTFQILNIMSLCNFKQLK